MDGIGALNLFGQSFVACTALNSVDLAVAPLLVCPLNILEGKQFIICKVETPIEDYLEPSELQRPELATDLVTPVCVVGEGPPCLINEDFKVCKRQSLSQSCASVSETDDVQPELSVDTLSFTPASLYEMG